ncbi:hypothetical protein EJ05DRAFT_505865 [Pseudovirgaria hyperparasitica]|uniref:Uncharacterized protein n=1 Tax=Pseudovirgaria hyperparasitica TaxID=470096 RepID=A0A6A6VPV0_9PEZI|nr:uncharacterized protein EJ05DRAFT_505865 [Pseudovirgaria hyperparasitica]KAF2752652.1 hypothetical protein EJ05DRAFT_505865 [Pseudovirgaria hyperparasitica]
MSIQAETKRHTIWPGSSSSSSLSDHKDEQHTQILEITEVSRPKRIRQRSFVSDSRNPRDLRLVPEKFSALQPRGQIPISSLSPWSSYESLYRIELCGAVAVVRKLTGSRALYMIKSTRDASRALEASQVRRHPNICQI